MFHLRSSVAILAMATVLAAQEPLRPVPVPPGFGPRPETLAPQPAKPEPAKPEPAKPAKPAPAQPGQAAKPATQQESQAVAAPPPSRVSMGGFSLQNASLVEVVDQLARVLKINYVLDPRVKGGVFLNTYGEVKNLDPRALLDMILRINGAAMIQVGEIYRVVPMADVARLPIRPLVDAQNIAEDDRVMLNLIFLKYAAVDELSKLLAPFSAGIP